MYYASYILVILALTGIICCDWQIIGTCANSTNPFQYGINAQNGYCSSQGFGKYFKYTCAGGNTAYETTCSDSRCTQCEPPTQVVLHTCSSPDDLFIDCSVKEPNYAVLLQTSDYVTLTWTMDQCQTINRVSAMPSYTCIPNLYNFASVRLTCNPTTVDIAAYKEADCNGKQYNYVAKIPTSQPPCSTDPDIFQYYSCFIN